MTDKQQRIGQLIIDEYESCPDHSTFFSGNNAEAIAEQYNLSRNDVAEVMEQLAKEYADGYTANTDIF